MSRCLTDMVTLMILFSPASPPTSHLLAIKSHRHLPIRLSFRSPLHLVHPHAGLSLSPSPGQSSSHLDSPAHSLQSYLYHFHLPDLAYSISTTFTFPSPGQSLSYLASPVHALHSYLSTPNQSLSFTCYSVFNHRDLNLRFKLILYLSFSYQSSPLTNFPFVIYTLKFYY